MSNPELRELVSKWLGEQVYKRFSDSPWKPDSSATSRNAAHSISDRPSRRLQAARQAPRRARIRGRQTASVVPVGSVPSVPARTPPLRPSP